jgi:hypothetical protein
MPCRRTSITFSPEGATLNGAHVLGAQGTAAATPLKSVSSATAPARVPVRGTNSFRFHMTISSRSTS